MVRSRRPTGAGTTKGPASADRSQGPLDPARHGPSVRARRGPDAGAGSAIRGPGRLDGARWERAPLGCDPGGSRVVRAPRVTGRRTDGTASRTRRSFPGQLSYSSGGPCGSGGRCGASSARRPSTAATARSPSADCTARTAISSPVTSSRLAQEDLRSKRTARTAAHGRSCEPRMLRTRTPASSASTRGRASSRMPAASTTPRPIIATWSEVWKGTTPVDEDFRKMPTTTITARTAAASPAQTTRIRRGTAVTGAVTAGGTAPLLPADSGRAGRVPGVEITGTAQHEAWQARALPPVERLREDLWSIPVPIPHGGLRYVTTYVLALADGGLGLIDTGWDSDDAWAALTRGLAALGGSAADGRGGPGAPPPLPPLRPAGPGG